MNHRKLARKRLETWENLLEATEEVIDLIHEIHDLDDLDEARRQRDLEARRFQYLLPFHDPLRPLPNRHDSWPERSVTPGWLDPIVPRDH